jgi:cysteine-rich repeat protein
VQFTLSSTTNLGVYVLDHCGVGVTELACADTVPGGLNEVASASVVGGHVYTVVVDGNSAAATTDGAFTLQAAFVSSCGNGTVDSGEECDDGNTMSGDGCSSTCTVELASYCNMAVAGALGSDAGDTSDGSSVFQGSCTGAGKEDLIGFTPATTGTMKIVLHSTLNLGVYARSTCADAKKELRCADYGAAGQDEIIFVPATMGQPVTVFVDGASGVQGAYTIDLSVM